jgi:hypothetical protein
MFDEDLSRDHQDENTNEDNNRPMEQPAINQGLGSNGINVFHSDISGTQADTPKIHARQPDLACLSGCYTGGPDACQFA